MFVLYKCILHSFVYLRNIFFPSDQSNFLEHGTKSCKSEERNGMLFSNCQRWNRGHKARGQGQGHKKKSEAKAKDSLSEDRHSRGQGQECSRPRTKDTSASALQKKKKKRSSQKFFKRSPRKNVFQIIFQALHKILTIQKIVLSSSRGQASFRGLEASRPRPRTKDFKMCSRGRPRGLHLW